MTTTSIAAEARECIAAEARECIAALLPFAEAEIETLTAARHEAGNVEEVTKLVQQIEEGQESLAIARRLTRRSVETDVRHPVLDAGDKIGAAMVALREEPAMQDDEVLKCCRLALVAAYDVLHEHLNVHYLWEEQAGPF